jgi:hypothetical protein
VSGNGALVGSITPQPTPDEVAAIVAAIGSCSFVVTVDGRPDDTLHEWVNTARLRSRRVGVQRGPWRFSGRPGRRSRV